MKSLIISTILTFVINTTIYSQVRSRSLSFKIGPTFNKSLILDSDEGYFFDSKFLDGFDLFERVEFGIFYTTPFKKKYELELGFRFTPLAAEIGNFFITENNPGFIGGTEVEEFLYYSMSVSLRKPYLLTNKITFTPFLELNMNIIDISFLTIDFDKCFTSDQSNFYECSDINYIGAPKVNSGIGLGGEFDFKLYKGINLQIWGKRIWRGTRGWGFNLTQNIHAKSNDEIVETHIGAVEAILNNWSFGLGIGFDLPRKK